MDIKRKINSLLLKNGIWYSGQSYKVSYPTDDYDECFNVEEDSYWFNHRNDILKSLTARFSKGKEFFDIGGGNGYVSKALISAGFDVCLIEPGQSGILNAQKRGLRNLINASFETLEFVPGSIDNAGLFDVIEHTEKDKDFLKTTHSSLSKNGRIFITVPAYKLLWSNADIHAGHFRRYSVKSLSSVIESIGFKVAYSTYFFSFLIPLIFIFRTIPSLFSKKPLIKKPEAEHSSKSGFLNKIIQWFCNYELKTIKKGKRIPFGSSCLVIAEKI